jgi:beta-galactosidase
MNGANHGERYWPDTTSYDYDAPLDEAGRPTPKFAAFYSVIKRHLPKGTKLPLLPPQPPITEIPEISLTERAPLEQLLQESVTAGTPVPMESLGQDYGFILYRREIAKATADVLEIDEVRDYAVVKQGERVFGSLDRRLGQRCLDVQLTSGTPLDILVENMGRVNFGARLVDDRKGITRKVTLAGEELRGWQIFKLPMNDLSRLRFSMEPVRGPAFFRGEFDLQAVGDTFLDFSGWGKGVAWVNGHNLGRFWRFGPQQTLYCPAPFLKSGRNEIIVFDLEEGRSRKLRGVKDPIFELKTGMPTLATP